MLVGLKVNYACKGPLQVYTHALAQATTEQLSHAADRILILQKKIAHPIGQALCTYTSTPACTGTVSHSTQLTGGGRASARLSVSNDLKSLSQADQHSCESTRREAGERRSGKSKREVQGAELSAHGGVVDVTPACIAPLHAQTWRIQGLHKHNLRAWGCPRDACVEGSPAEHPAERSHLGHTALCGRSR